MDDVEKIKQKLDIADYIGKYVKLSRGGRNLKGICPFHAEKTPSFMVSPERQIWHCFGCQKGGDIFSFLMEYEKLDFSESLKTLAQEAGIQLTQPVYRTAQEEKKDTVYTLNAYAAQFYHYLLTQHPIGKQALEYLTEKRQIPIGLIEKLQLGYAPHKGTALTNYLLKKKNQKMEDLVNAGLVTQIRGRNLDFFMHRILFPIHDVRGNILAFSGRALDDATLPKYINTRETIVYKKSGSLYGIFQAKDAIKKENKILLVEGEFDVISCFKEGIGYAAALKGTALTDDQIKLIKRYADKILFCFDTDIAGTAAQKRSIALIEKEGLSSAVVIPPEGKDPDELLRENPALFKKALKEEVNTYDYIISSAVKVADTATPEGKRAVLNETLPILSQIDNEVIKEHYLKKLAENLSTSFDSVLKQSQKKAPIPPPQIPKQKKTILSREEITETYLVSLILQAKDPLPVIQLVESILQHVGLSTTALNLLWKDISKYTHDTGAFSVDEFAKQLPSELLEAFDKCLLAPIPEFEDEKHYIKEVKRVAVETSVLSIKQKIKLITDQLQGLEDERDSDKIVQLQQEFTAYTTLLNQIKITPLE